MKKVILFVVLLVVGIVGLAACAGDPLLDDLYITDLYALNIYVSGLVEVIGNITVANLITAGLVDGRDVSVDGAKLDTIETNADVTDATNVNIVGATMNTDFNAKGDILSASADDTPLILSVGTDTYVLTADSTEATGLKWVVVAESRIFYGVNTSTTNLSTSLATIIYGTVVRSDSGYSHSNGEVTVTNAGWYEIHWSIVANGASSHVEMRSELQVDGAKVKGMTNYSAGNSTYDTGGISGHHVVELSGGEVIRVQAVRQGSTANKVAGDCSLLIKRI
tara:strand:+ start:9815 stop:10651 length:837 start_codon:yes stop_codon:yes gene_type:complete